MRRKLMLSARKDGPRAAFQPRAMTSHAPPSNLLRATGASLAGRLAGVDLELATERCVVIVGPNGGGKSSLLRVLAGLEKLDDGLVTLGTTPLAQLTPRERAEHIAWLPQRPSLGDALTTSDLVTAARYRFGESLATAREQGIEALEKMGAGDLAGRRVDRISGGELQRVLLATLVAQSAPLLLVDEPANHLDPRHQLDTYRRLGKLWRDEGRGILIVTHDIRLATVLGPRADIRVVGLREGRLAFSRQLDDPHLSTALEELYGVPFVGAGEAGELAICLDQFLDTAPSEPPDVPASETSQ